MRSGPAVRTTRSRSSTGPGPARSKIAAAHGVTGACWTRSPIQPIPATTTRSTGWARTSIPPATAARHPHSFEKVAMTGKQRSTRPGLGEYLDALATRLRILGPEQVVTALVAHAGRLPARSREGFPDIFPDPGTTYATGSQSEHLLADIDAFAERARAGDFDGEQEQAPAGVR